MMAIINTMIHMLNWPKMDDKIRRMTRVGITIIISAILIKKASMIPPAYAEIIPITVPSTMLKKALDSPTIKATFAPSRSWAKISLPTLSVPRR